MKLYLYSILSLLGLIVGAFVMHSVASHPSMVLINVGETTIEMSFWFAASALLLGMIVLILLWKAFWWLLASLASSVSWIQESRDKRAERRTHLGLIHFVTGDWLHAKKDLIGGAKDTKKPLVNYLLAARSAFELGDTDESHFLLEQAEKAAGDDLFSITISRARLSLLEKKYPECVLHIQSLPDSLQRHAAAVDVLRHAYIHLHRWAELAALLPDIKNTGLLTAEDFAQLEENTHLALFEEKAQLAGQGPEDLTRFWESQPKHIRKNIRLIGMYATWLHRYGADEIARTVIVKTLKNQWHSGLAELFGQLTLEDKDQQFKTAQNWLGSHPGDAKLLFVLGKLANKHSLWGQARDYFEKSIALQPCAKTYAQLADVLAHMGEHEDSAAMYKKGLQAMVEQEK